jgi:hypothetical protein
MDRLALLFDCSRRMWRLQWGDPDPLGLALTAGYVTVLVLLLRVVLRACTRFQGSRDRQLWLLTTFCFGLLTANKQLDLQHTMMNIGRCYATVQGWYDNRAGLEHGTALTLLVLALALAAGLTLWFRSVLAANRPLLAGLGLLAAYVLLQMADALHLDQVLQTLIDTVALHRAVEAAALLALGIAAFRKA